MSKKFTMLLTALFLVIGTMSAEGLIVGQRYRLKNVASGLYMQNMGDNTNLKLQAEKFVPTQFFYLEEAENGQYYVKTSLNCATRYMNASGWNSVVSSGKDTPYTISLVEGQTDVYTLNQTVSGYKGNLGADGTGVGESLYCNKGTDTKCQWQFEAVETPVAWTYDPEKTYRIKSEYSGLYMELVNPTQTSGEGAFQFKNKSANAGQQFKFEAAEGEDAGKYYLKTVDGDNTYYVNASSWNFYAGADATTPFEIALVGDETAIYSLNQQVAEYKGYAGDDNDAVDGTKIYNNKGSLTKNTIWSFEEVKDVVVEITYIYKYGETELKRETVNVVVGAPYTFNLPWGYATTLSGTVAEAGEVTVDCTVDLPFEYAASVGEITKWYYVQMKSNDKKFIQSVVTETENYIEWADANRTEGETESYLWAFVGNMTDGFKMVNNATGTAIKSIGSGNPVLADVNEATAWIASQSKVAGNQYFCFKYPDGEYMNAQSGKIAHWGANDEGSTFNVVEAETYTINYTYTYELNEVQHEIGTASATVCVGCPYPAVNAPFGFAAETPAGKVLADDARTIACTDNLPFEYAATVGEINNWYYMQMHSNDKKYIKRVDNGLTWEDATVNEAEISSYAWAFVGDPINGFKVVNQAAGVESALLSTGNNGDAVTLTTFADATPLLVKASSQNNVDFCLKSATGNYLNATVGTVKHWGDNDAGSTIKVTKVMPKHDLTVTYMFKNAQLGEQSTARVDEGSTYTFANPYAGTNKYVTVACTANGNRIDEVDGQWSVPVTGTTNIIVTITEDLPFKTSTSFATANWQYLQINSAGWKYVRNFVAEGDENTYSNTTDVAALGENAQWAFVGDALNGFKILNKTAGDGYTLSYDGEMGDGTAAYMKQEEKTWTIEKGNGGFVIRQDATECLNDFGGKLKVWKADGSPEGTGSAFRTISASVANKADLCFPGVFTLQAERSPLLYDASANVADANKLSSGMASGIAANGNDANQQFLISESETDGLYYLYSVGAAKFVDAELNFTDYPQPVLSFEANEGNSVFPWFVKIGGKYVVPGNGGTAGNKLFHQESVSDDDGKRYRIEKVGEDISLTTSVALIIQSSVGLIKEASQLSNSKVYAVFTSDRGAWYHNGDDALWSTGKTAKPGGAAENADHFAFLTVNGKIYLYSVGAGKFIVKSEAQHGGMYYAAYSDTPAQTVELLAATNGGWFPVVVKLNAPSAPSQLAISNSYAYPVVMYDDLSDTGNQVRIEEIGTLDLSAVVAQIEAYQMDEEAKGGLQTLITEATTKNAYLENASLTAAIAAAQAALDKVGATYDELMTAKENLAAALNSALYVTEINGFSNNYVYTFVSKRGWMGALAAAENTNVISTAKNTVDPEASDANTLFQWAVYTSESGKQYLYNIGKQMFMGVQSTNNASVPFAATPQGQLLTFKKSDWADYPIMFSTDNAGVVNHTTSYGEGLVTWTGGWDNLTDEGSNHKVTIVGKIESSTLTTIAAAVELYETQGVAVQALDAAIAAAQAKVNGIGNGLGYYSTTEAEAAATLAAIVDFKNAITGETAVAAIEAQTAAANALVETFSVNLPEAGKFYRFSYDYGTAGVKYVQAVASNVSGKANAMVMTEEQGAASIFYFADGKLLSYSAGQYVKESGNTRGLQAVGAEAGAARFEAGSVAGKLYIFAGDSFHANKDGDVCFIDHCGAGHPDKGAGDEHNFTVEEVAELPLTIGSAGYSTFYTSVAVEIPDGVTAYVITAAENGMVVLSEVTDDVVPDSTGLILEGNGEYNFTIATEDAPAEFNKGLLKGTAAKTLITAEANTNYYVLAKPAGAEEAGLYKAALNKNEGTAFQNGANKAYLPVVVEVAAEAPAMFSFGRGQGTTSIENAELATDNAELVIYDLTGRRVEKMVKGIYIVNGKKVLVK